MYLSLFLNTNSLKTLCFQQQQQQQHCCCDYNVYYLYKKTEKHHGAAICKENAAAEKLCSMAEMNICKYCGP
jgi:hypothetical protein